MPSSASRGSKTTIDGCDPHGVALDAIQGLSQKNAESRTRIAELETVNGELEKRMERLEAVVRGLTVQ